MRDRARAETTVVARRDGPSRTKRCIYITRTTTTVIARRRRPRTKMNVSRGRRPPSSRGDGGDRPCVCPLPPPDPSSRTPGYLRHEQPPLERAAQRLDGERVAPLAHKLADLRRDWRGGASGDHPDPSTITLSNGTTATRMSAPPRHVTLADRQTSSASTVPLPSRSSFITRSSISSTGIVCF